MEEEKKKSVYIFFPDDGNFDFTTPWYMVQHIHSSYQYILMTMIYNLQATFPVKSTHLTTAREEKGRRP